MDPRITVALLSATMLAGCGFSDSTNYAGGDFLDAQGISVSPRANVSLGAAIKAVEYLPPEGYPARPGTGPFVIGRFGTDSIRAVFAFDLRDTSKALGGVGTLKVHPIKSVRLTVASSASYAVDSLWDPKLRVRFVWIDSSVNVLPALLLGVEPEVLTGVGVLQDTVMDLQDSAGIYSIPVGTDLANVVCKRFENHPGWLAVVLDPQSTASASQNKIFAIRTGDEKLPVVLQRDSGELGIGTYDKHPAYNSVQLRGAGKANELGIWNSGGGRVRFELDGDKIRQSLHRQVAVSDETEEYDNSFHLLQARAHLGFGSLNFSNNISAARTSLSSRTIESEDTIVFTAGAVQSLPLRMVSNTEAGLSGPLTVECAEIVASKVVQCAVKVNGVVPTSFPQKNFWLRSDVRDRAEFSMLANLRISIATDPSNPGKIQLIWTLIHTLQYPDSQNDSAGIRAQAYLKAGSSSIELEIRSALSQVIVQKKRKVVLELAPLGADALGLNLWSARLSPDVIDSVHILLRPRDGRNF